LDGSERRLQALLRGRVAARPGSCLSADAPCAPLDAHRLASARPKRIFNCQRGRRSISPWPRRAARQDAGSSSLGLERVVIPLSGLSDWALIAVGALSGCGRRAGRPGAPAPACGASCPPACAAPSARWRSGIGRLRAL